MSYLSRFEDWAQTIDYGSETEYETVQSTISKFKTKLAAQPDIDEEQKADLDATIEAMTLALDSFDCHAEQPPVDTPAMPVSEESFQIDAMLSLDGLGDPADPNAKPLNSEEKKTAVEKLVQMPGISLGVTKSGK